MAAGATAVGDTQYPNSNGLHRTLLVSSTPGVGTPATPRMLQVPVPAASANDPQFYHPYQQDALLNKIFNSLTTRSNVFAVYMTVGFFEVNDDTTRPVKLGAELGRAENRHVRHRMFALADRTSLTSFSFQSPSVVTIPTGQSSTFPSPPATAQATMSIPPVAQRIDPRTGRPWVIVPGMVLNVDYGGVCSDQNSNPPNSTMVYAEENVVVLAVDNPINTITAVFTKQHNIPANPNGVTIRCFGNPGPWTRYDPRQDNQVVPYFSIID
jgi:hypothetical protein